MCTHWRQTTANERAYGAQRIHTLVRLAETGFCCLMTLNPQSTLNNVGLLVRPQHSPCPCYTPVPDRCWRVGTTDFRRNSLAHLSEQQSQLCQPVSQALRWKIQTTKRCALFALVMSQRHAVATLSYSQPSMTKYHR